MTKVYYNGSVESEKLMGEFKNQIDNTLKVLRLEVDYRIWFDSKQINPLTTDVAIKLSQKYKIEEK